MQHQFMKYFPILIYHWKLCVTSHTIGVTHGDCHQNLDVVYLGWKYMGVAWTDSVSQLKKFWISKNIGVVYQNVTN